MSQLKRLATQHPILFSGTITLVFLLLLVVVIVAGRVLPGARGAEAGGAIGRIVLTLLFIFLLARLGWLRQAGLSDLGGSYAWLIALGPFLYVIAVYPLLFTGSISLRLDDPGLAALVAANGLAAGVMEEVVFRGVVLCSLLRRWGADRRGVAKSILVASVLFSAPHALNLLAGHETLRVAAQLVWAFLLGGVFGALLVAGGSLWPIAALHGLSNAVIHVNRLGTTVQLSNTSAGLLAIAPIPLVAYAFALVGRGSRLPPDTGDERAAQQPDEADEARPG